MLLFIFVNLLIVIKVKINTKVSTQSLFSGDFKDIVYEHYYMLERKLGMPSKPNKQYRTEKRKKKRSYRRDRENTSVVFQIHVQFYMSPTQIRVIQRSLHFRKGKTNCFVPQAEDINKTEKKWNLCWISNQRWILIQELS